MLYSTIGHYSLVLGLCVSLLLVFFSIKNFKNSEILSSKILSFTFLQFFLVVVSFSSLIISFALSLNKDKTSAFTLFKAYFISLIDALIMSFIYNITCWLWGTNSFEFYFGSFFYLINKICLLISIKCYACSLSSSPCCSTRSMDIVVYIFWRVKLYYQIFIIKISIISKLLKNILFIKLFFEKTY